MKSKNDPLFGLLIALTHLLMASRTWLRIRDQLSDILENYIDSINYDVADRILELAELLDEISLFFSKKIIRKQ